MRLFKREPAVIIGVVTAIVTGAVIFGVLSPEKGDAIKGVLASLIPLVAAFAVRSQVASPATVARVAVETAARVTPGSDLEVPKDAVSRATGVVSETLGTTVDVAGNLVGGVLEGTGKLVKGVL